MSLHSPKLYADTAEHLTSADLTESTNRSIEHLEISSVTELQKISQCKIILAGVAELKLSNSAEIKLSSISLNVFPGLSSLHLVTSTAIYDSRLTQLRTLSMTDCNGSVDFHKLYQACDQLQLLRIWSCTLLVDVSKMPQWNSLQELTLECTALKTMADDLLNDNEAEHCLTKSCPNAHITMDRKVGL